MSSVTLDIYDNGEWRVSGRARSLAEFREQLAEMRRLGVD